MLQLNKMYFPEIGGVEQVVQALAEGLRDQVDMKVLVCNTKPRTERGEVNGVDVVRAASFARVYSMPLSARFFAEVRRASVDVDVLQLHVPFPLGDVAALLFRRRAKLIVWWHSDLVRQWLFARLYAPITRLLLRRAARIVVATPSHVSHTPALGKHREKCVTIQYGIDTRKYELTEGVRARAAAIRAEYGSPLALFVGRLVYYKGVDVLIRAMASVSGRLLIVGEGPLEPALRAMVIDLNLQDKVSFTRAGPGETLAPLFHACDVFVLPSVARSEAFGIVQLEAMACAKPVINTRLESGAPGVSLHGQTGLTVDAGDAGQLASALNSLFSDPALRATYGRDAQARANTWGDVRRMLNSTMRLYEDVARSR